jgi:spermidine synthase
MTIQLLARAGLVVFLANCAILVLQLVAGRLLSPFIGVSLATWTAVIGVFLLGISLGNWLGGTVADRYPSTRTLGWLLVLGALGALGMLALVAALGDGSLLRPLPLYPRIALLTLLIGLPPSLVLSMITPLAIKVMLADVRGAGRVAGRVYALGTLGSLVGNFLTGFVLVAALSLDAIVVAVAAVLFVASLGTSDWWRGLPRAVVVPPAWSPNERPRASGLAGNLPLACAVAAVASFCTIQIELAASRLLAPHVGVSLYTWTGIIGVVLAGIALGNYLGGRLADRWPHPAVVGGCLSLGGIACLAILPLLDVVTRLELTRSLGLVARIVTLSVALFLVPVLLLGTISPQLIRLVMPDLAHGGQVAGRIYAWSTAGAIAGTFAVGWVLISLLGVHWLVAGSGMILLAVGTLVALSSPRRAPAIGFGALGVAAVGLLVVSGKMASPCTMETNYFCIRTYDIALHGGVRVLVLDHFVHAYVKIDDPSQLVYEHEQVHADLTQAIAARTPAPNVLLIGAGGYTYPRWVEAFVPGASMDVVEIDPGVTETAHRDLGLARDTRIRSYNVDGRQFVQELAPRRHYQLVVQHASNDLSVPYHLVTKEYNDAIHAILDDGGVYLLTLTDHYREGRLLRAAVRTMQRTFPHVHLLAGQPAWVTGGAYVYVVYGSDRPLDLNEVRDALRVRGAGSLRTTALSNGKLQAYVAAGPQIVLTDRYAPVDNLVSVLYGRGEAWSGSQ